MLLESRVYVGGRCDDRDKKRAANTRDRAFFSGVLGQVVSGLEFFVFSLVDVARRRAYPVAVGQTIRSEAEKAAARLMRKKKRTRKTTKNKKAAGRKKGSVNKDKNELNLSPELERINKLLAGVLKLLRVFVKVEYLALDAHFGHNRAVLMAMENDLHLISKMRRDAALFEKYVGGYGGRGARKEVWETIKI